MLVGKMGEADGDVISVCQPDPGLRAYVLGGMSYRVSVHTQQLRAVRLVSALINMKKMNGGERVAVIGAGFGGLTCAAALAAKGLKVDVFERSSNMLPIHSKNRTRILHPSSVVWPTGDLSDTTNLPFLNWYTDYCQEVSNTFCSEFNDLFLSETSRNILMKFESNVEKISPPEKGHQQFEIQYNNSNKENISHADIVIMSTGFNHERKISGFDRTSYWEDRNSLPITFKGTCPRVAIVGDGDGALADLFRCYWSNLDVERVYRAIGDSFLSTDEVKNEIEVKEKQALTNQSQEFLNDYEYFYRNLLSISGADRFLESIPVAPCEVAMFGKGRSPFSVKAAPLNKAILGYLYIKKLFTFTSAEVDEVIFRGKQPYHVKKGSTASKLEDYTLRLDGERIRNSFFSGFGWNNTSKHFDRVIERIGPIRTYCRVTSNLFGESQLEKFLDLHSTTLILANPIDGTQWDYSDDKKGLERAKFDRATGSIRSFLEKRLDIELPDQSVRVNGNLKIEVDCEDEHTQADKVPPKRWYGIDVVYNNVDISKIDENKVRAANPDRAFLQATPVISHSVIAESPEVGSLIVAEAIAEVADYEESLTGLFGRISGFVKPVKPRNLDEIYCIFPKHIMGNFNHSTINQVVKGNSLSPIAVTNGDFKHKLLQFRQADKYSIFNDFQIARLFEGVEFKNEINSSAIKHTKSPFYHLKTGNADLFANGEPVGNIGSIFNHMRMEFSVFSSIFTETFTIKCKSNVDITKIESGTMIHSKRFKGVGFVIGNRLSTNELYCVEYDKIFRRLDLEFV